LIILQPGHAGSGLDFRERTLFFFAVFIMSFRWFNWRLLNIASVLPLVTYGPDKGEIQSDWIFAVFKRMFLIESRSFAELREDFIGNYQNRALPHYRDPPPSWMPCCPPYPRAPKVTVTRSGEKE
jgi:hypothetical protein